MTDRRKNRRPVIASIVAFALPGVPCEAAKRAQVLVLLSDYLEMILNICIVHSYIMLYLRFICFCNISWILYTCMMFYDLGILTYIGTYMEICFGPVCLAKVEVEHALQSLHISKLVEAPLSFPSPLPFPCTLKTLDYASKPRALVLLS